MGYPAEIYISTARGEEITDPIARTDREKAYNIGKTDSESLDGWANLTQAIQDDLNIDWEKLDGLPCKCVHPELGTLTHKLDRDVSELEVDQPWAWFSGLDYSTWISALIDAWKATSDWTLWIKGEIPLKPKTADQLPDGMIFTGTWDGTDDESQHLFIVCTQACIQGTRRVVTSPHGAWGTLDPKRVTVHEEHGIGILPKEAA